jgi:hypothetical protein
MAKDSGNEFGVYQERKLAAAKVVKYLHLFFYLDEDHHGRAMIREATMTRLRNVKKNKWYDGDKHKAFGVPIQSVDEIIEQISKIIAKHGGKEKVFIKEVGFFSHAGGDGPLCYNKKVVIHPEPKFQSQMMLEGWALIDFNWAKDSRFVFYGCNTANNGGKFKNFAENISNLSNFSNVAVWGQSTSSFPSFYPDFRVTTGARSMSDWRWNAISINTYQVACGPDLGYQALNFNNKADLNLTPAELTKKGYPKANVLHRYEFGVLVQSSHQGIFNNHR